MGDDDVSYDTLLGLDRGKKWLRRFKGGGRTSCLWCRLVCGGLDFVVCCLIVVLDGSAVFVCKILGYLMLCVLWVVSAYDTRYTREVNRMRCVERGGHAGANVVLAFVHATFF